MATITIFKNAKDTKNPYYTNVETIVHRIRVGQSKELVEKIRNEQDIKKRKELKILLPSICFSGKFSAREDKALLKHSGLVAIDFDHLNDRVDSFKDRVCKDKFTHVAFISPSGDGIKIIVKIPDSIKTHKLSCDALSDYYKEESLDDFKDVSRICFESYDPDIYYNPNSDIFKTLKEVQVIKRTIETTHIITDFDKIIDNLVIWLSKRGDIYQDGNKHKFLVKLASACNRFGIPECIAVQKVIYKFIHTASQVDPKDFEDLFSRVYKNYGNLACTAHFDEKGEAIETVSKIKLTDAIFDITLPLKDVIYLDSVWEDMLQTFHTGRARGETTYFKTIDEHWRMKRRHLVLMHGIANHGKSAIVKQICLIKSVKDNYKWAFFSPEEDPPSDFYDDLIQSYIGANTQPYFKDQMTKEDYTLGKDFIKDHFFYVFPDNDSPNQDYINKRFEEIILKHKIDGCIIDPYNQLDNDIRKFGGREDQYLSSFLTIQKRFAQKHDIFMIIVAHPKGGLSKNGQGDYQCPDIYDLAGGAMWGNKCDDILCTYRPFFTSDRENTSVKFISQKIKKRKLCGVPGEIILDFDVKSNRFYESINDEKRSPFNPEIQTDSYLQSNFDFYRTDGNDAKDLPF